jgi:hypothetical protein
MKGYFGGYEVVVSRLSWVVWWLVFSTNIVHFADRASVGGACRSLSGGA